MFTLDASIFVSAALPSEVTFLESKSFLIYLRENPLIIYSPTLLLVEVAAALSRTINNADRTVAISREVQSLPNHRWVLLDFELANEAAEIGANHRLRGADAVYAAVARRHKATLVTLDRQQLERLPPLLEVRTPGEVLSTFQG